VPVGQHLADQLLLPLGIGAHQGTGGGTFRTLDLTPHAWTHIDVLRAFLDVDVRVEESAGGTATVTVMTPARSRP
jgi:RNA 3'-terminal phosphate cyclase (ATP)